MRYIISTIGTSTLTNSINEATEGHWRGILGASANLTEDELSDESQNVDDPQNVTATLTGRAHEKLRQNDVETHRRASAELNGIYGIYEGTLPEQSGDQHYLICTDTFQGRKTGEMIRNFLERQGFKASVVIPTGLSTKDTDSFTDGIKELIQWLENNVSWQQSSVDHQVIFNLVGGFKSLQGYMQTFGAFYADETVYIFEGSSELIKIPRLPIQIDTTEIQQYRGQFAMMEVEAPCQTTKVTGVDNISKTLLYIMEDNGEAYVGLSAWGILIWNRTKGDLLENDINMIQEELPESAQIQLALMNAGKQYLKAEIDSNIPDALLESVHVNGTPCAKLSVWGKSVWNKAKGDLLGKKEGLLSFPRLQYKGTFTDDFKNQNDKDQRFKLQETLAKVAYLLEKHNGSTVGLTGGDLKYDPYNSHPGICHFYVDGSRRVSCEAHGGNLILRHCGAHDYVNDNP